jgi:deaminated glutathione amidase
MTPWLGFAGFGEAPTRAIVCVSRRMSSGLLKRLPSPWAELSCQPMSETLRVACVQLTSRSDKAANLEKAQQLVARAAATGADVVILPEKWNAIGGPDVLHGAAETLDDGESVQAMAAWARQYGVALVGGSITERREGREKLSNTSIVFDSEGSVVGVYRKIHMFDVDVGGHVYRESDAEEPGDEPVLVDVEGWPTGLTVCYDVRFPELYRILALQGAELVTVPAHFTLYTGKDHWELLLRARAVENQCYIAAANQWGVHAEGKASYGRTMIVDPWGVVLAQAPDEDAVVSAELDRAHMDRVRRALPSLANRQPAAYTWPAEV